MRHRHTAPDPGGTELFALAEHFEQDFPITHLARGGQGTHHLPKRTVPVGGGQFGDEVGGFEEIGESDQHRAGV